MFYSVVGFIFFHTGNVDHITTDAPNRYVKFTKNKLGKNRVTYLQKEKKKEKQKCGLKLQDLLHHNPSAVDQDQPFGIFY